MLGGASGAGKSTLTTLLRRGALATDGSIQLGHFDESGEYVGTEYKDIQNIIDNVGVAFQSAPEAECMSVDEYIMLENPNADPKKVKEVKELLGIGVEGESGIIDENANVSNRLSGGQQKRIELARVLIKDSPIMILDEPTSGVDEGMSENIVEYLKELGKEKTIIYITHDAREIEKIGAYQAIDIDKIHSEDGETNTIRAFDISDEKEREVYIGFFLDRKRKTDEEIQKQEELEKEQREQQEAQKREEVAVKLSEVFELVRKRGEEDREDGGAEDKSATVAKNEPVMSNNMTANELGA